MLATKDSQDIQAIDAGLKNYSNDFIEMINYETHPYLNLQTGN